LGCVAARLCGSGSALFGICLDGKHAAAVAVALAEEGLWSWAGEALH
jgi:hypothetical protein